MSRDRPYVHIDPVMVEAYAAQLVDAGSAVTIERHLTWCQHCRVCVAAAGIRGELPGLSPGRLEGIWTAVVEAIDDSPPTSVPHRMRHYLRLAGNRLQNLLAGFEIPKTRMIPRARRVIVTVMAAITISTLVCQGTSVSADRWPADLPTGGHEFCPFVATKLPGFGRARRWLVMCVG